jgi:hypothetical protein
MSKPDLDDGWAQLAHELQTAIFVASFTKAEMIVLDRIMAQLYGLSKLDDAIVVPSDLGILGGWPRTFISKGLGGLLRAGVIVAAAAGYRLHKRYREWTFADGTAHPDRNGSRFSNAELAYIHTSPDREKITEAVARINKPVSDARKKRTSLDTGQKSERIQRDTKAYLPRYESVSNEIQKRTSLDTGHIETHAIPIGELRIENKDFVIDDAAEISGIPKTRAELATWVARAFKPIESMDAKLAGWSTYPIDWIHHALQCSLSTAKPGKYAAYANRCLAQWQANGGPEQLKPENRNGHVPDVHVPNPEILAIYQKRNKKT